MATLTRTKAALIRREGYPVGRPAPCFLRCCDNEIDAPVGDALARCPTCGTRFDARGYVVSGTISVKVTFGNGNSLVTGINTDLEGARRYYLGNWFNLGVEDDDMQQAVAVDLV